MLGSASETGPPNMSLKVTFQVQEADFLCVPGLVVRDFPVRDFFFGSGCSPEGSDTFVRKYSILSKLIFLLLILEVIR